MPTVTTFQQKLGSGSIQTLLSTALNSLANNALALTAAFTPANYQRRALVEIAISGFGGNVAVNGAISLWSLASIDGTTYEDGGASLTPARFADRVFPLRSGISGAQTVVRWVPLAPGASKLLLKNDATGQALASSGNTLRILEIDDLGNAP